MTRPATHIWRLGKWARIAARHGALRGVQNDPNTPAPVKRLIGLFSIGTVKSRQPDYAGAFQAIGPAAIKRALDTMRSYQKLGLATGAAHAAAFCNSEGDIVLVREDVGRHNALDKLIGALGRAGVDHREGFVLLTARCSQELVEKTVRAGIPMLATISAPSSLAIARAREGRLTLLALARSDTALVVNDPHQLFAKNRP